MGQNVRNILVLRRHNHVGDMLCSLPLYAALKQQWPDAKIALLATPTRYPIPLQELNPFLDEVMYYQKGSLSTVLQDHWKLRTKKYDLAIVPSTVALSRTSHITAFASGAPMRVGIRSLDGVLNPSRRWLNMAVDVNWVTEQTHQLQRNLQIAEAAGCRTQAVKIEALRLAVKEHVQARADGWLAKISADGPLIGVHPGAGKPQNVWPVEKFIQVLQEVHDKTGCAVVITAGALDATEVAGLSSGLERSRIPFRILAQAEIPMLTAVLSRLKLYLCNDTGTMHIAAFSGCPTVSLFGPTFAWEWAPQGTEHHAVVSDDGDIASIEVGAVRDACLSRLMSRG
jgi:ADP-heptose:LPS heptosyltransferase